MKKIIKKGLSIVLCLSMVTVPYNMSEGTKKVKAEATEGSLATEITGTWSYWDGSKDVVKTNANLLEKLPSLVNKNKTRFTTDNYDANTGAIDVGGFSSSMIWNYTTDAFGETVYAIPLAYCGNANGMYFTKPSTQILTPSAWTKSVSMSMPKDGSLTDLIVGTDYSFASTKVDVQDEWLTRVVMENKNDPSQYMSTTIVQGSPFGYFELEGSEVMTVKRPRTLPSVVSHFNGSTIEDSTMIIVRFFDNMDEKYYSNYDYYAIYVPAGTKVSQGDATARYGDNKMGDLSFDFTDANEKYLSVAWLCESKSIDDNSAKEIAESYKPYAYNVIRNTTTSFNVNAGKVETTYSYDLEELSDSEESGTIMGILPHQYKNMSGYTYLSNTARTIRGTMKYLVGDSYKTNLSYTGILPAMPNVDVADNPQLKAYIDSFMDFYGPTETAVTKEKYDINTYDTGKKLNRAVQVLNAAESIGDSEDAEKILKGIEAELSDWFTASGENDKKYFYYDESVGSLYGFPQAYYTVDGMTDHHFHYGYFINAAAQVAFRDPEYIKKYENVINEIIGDIATYEDNKAGSRYPFLRYFDTYEGHSWASGHGNFGDGNNQESSSEATNTWSGLILYGQATGNKELTDLGIYMYTTEISAINNYWFDIDGDVLDEHYKSGHTYNSYPAASMIWGGKYDYATWWTDEPWQIQGINILPMSSSTFYLAANKEYILNYVKAVQENEAKFQAHDNNAKDPYRWNEIWAEYLALADPEAAIDFLNEDCEAEAGESKAHAFQYTNSLAKYGTPNLTVTSDYPLATAFGYDELTYVVYNNSDEAVKVTFSDGAVITANPGMNTIASDNVTSKAKYKVRHYTQDEYGQYQLTETENKSAGIGSTVTAKPKTYNGFTFYEESEKNIVSGEVLEDGSLELKLYYIRTVEREPETIDTSDFTKLGESNGATLSYKILRDDFNVANVQLLDGNDTFFVVYPGTFNSGNTTGYINQAINSGLANTGVCKLSVRSTLKIDNFYSIKMVSGSKHLYIVIKYGNPTGAPNLSDYESKGEETTANTNLVLDPVGLIVTASDDNAISVIFNATDEQKELGYMYHIFLDGAPKLLNVEYGSYLITGILSGKHTITVRSLYDGKLSDGVSATVKVVGVDDPTEAPTTTRDPELTKIQVTTKQKPTTVENTTIAPTNNQDTTGNSGTTFTGERPPKPEGFGWAGNGNLPYYFAWMRGSADSYNFYVNGVLKKTGIVEGLYNAPPELFPTDGVYNVGLTAVKNGVESEMVVVTKEFTGSGVTEVPTTQKQTTTAAPTTTEKQTATEAKTTENITTDNNATSIESSTNAQTEGTTNTATSDITTTAALTPETTTVLKTTNKQTTATKISVKRAVIKKAKRIKKASIKVTIKKIKGINGFRVAISTTRKFKKKTTIYKFKKKRIFVIKKLKANKKYFVRVKAYKLIGTTKIFSRKWSKVKKVKAL